MNKLHFSIIINAPKEKVWDTMLNDATYRKWTSVFVEGSYYKGNWEKGSKIQFLGPNPETKEEGGMVAEIEENRPYEFISIKHLGFIGDGAEELWGEGKYIYENYTFSEKDGGTEVGVDITNVPDEYKEMFNEVNKLWPNALKKLKKITEEGK